MSDTPAVEESVSSKELTRRAWIALGVAEVAFSFFAVLGGIGALYASDAADLEGWGDLGLVVIMLMAGVASVLVAIPFAVHTVGKFTVRKTQGWPARRAGLAHLAVGLALGSLSGAIIVASDIANIPAALLAFVLPPGLAGWTANTLVPYAARHRWLAVTVWALAAVPIGLSLYAVATVFLMGQAD